MCSGTRVGVHPDPRVNTQRPSRLSTPASDVQLFFFSSHAICCYSLSFLAQPPVRSITPLIYFPSHTQPSLISPCGSYTAHHMIALQRRRRRSHGRERMIGTGGSVCILKAPGQTVGKRGAEGVTVCAGGLLQGALRSTDLGRQIFRPGNGVGFELTTSQLQVRRTRWTPSHGDIPILTRLRSYSEKDVAMKTAPSSE